jgi:hypothetical protein
MGKEIQMADATKPEGNATTVEPVATIQPVAKTWADDEVRNIIAERDKAKAKLRKVEEDEQKALEAKAIEEGRLKEVLGTQKAELEQLRKFKEAKDAEESTLREQALAKLTDEDKRIVAELSTPNLLAFVERQTRQLKQPPAPNKGAAVDGPEGSVQPLPGETNEQYAVRMKKIGKVR